MFKLERFLRRMLPAALMMLLIFWFSAQPSTNLPDFDWLDRIVKKGGHMLGYAFLALSYWHMFAYQPGKQWLAWIFALLYAVTDEVHQSFTPGRFPSVVDVLVYDNFGALIAVWIVKAYHRRKRAVRRDPVMKT
jgi:VanZ family protein